MNSPRAEFFEDEPLRQKLRKKLSHLFHIAEIESSRAGKIGMAVGSARERILISLLTYKFGEENVGTKIPITEPASFPIELPYRLIQLFTFKDEVGLDPFCDSGTACIAALKAGRHHVRYDIKTEYAQLTEKRIQLYKQQPPLLTMPS